MSVSLLNNPSVAGSLYPAFGGVSAGNVSAENVSAENISIAYPGQLTVGAQDTGSGTDPVLTIENTSGALRWSVGVSGLEPNPLSNSAGSDLVINRWQDNGIPAVALYLNRSQGLTYNVPALGAKYFGVAQPFQAGGGNIGIGGTWQIFRTDAAAAGSYPLLDIVSGATGTYGDGTYSVLINGDYINGFAQFTVAGGIVTGVPQSAVSIARNDNSTYACAVSVVSAGPLANIAVQYTQGAGVTANGPKNYLTTIMRVA